MATKIAVLPDGNWLVRTSASLKYYYQANPPGVLTDGPAAAVPGYIITGGLTGATVNIIGGMTQTSIPINITTPSGSNIVYNPTTGLFNLPSSAPTVGNAQGSGYTANQIASLVNAGIDNDQVKAFFANGNNATAIEQATSVLGYPVPTTIDANGTIEFMQLYWGAYYLSKYPIPPADGSSCGLIAQTLINLADEKANNATGLSQSEVENLFSAYTQEDYIQRAQAISDIITIFNSLSGQLNCTGVIANGSGTTTPSAAAVTVTWVVIAVVIVGIIALIVRHREEK